MIRRGSSFNDLENLIVYARSIHDLDGDLVSHFGSFDLLVVNLHRGDLLRKVGRVAEKVDLVVHRKLAFGHARIHDQVFKIVE